MKRIARWVVIGFIGLVILAAILPDADETTGDELPTLMVLPTGADVMPTGTDSEVPMLEASATETSVPIVTKRVEDLAREVFVDTFSSQRELMTLVVNDLVVTMRFPLTDLSASSARFEAESRFVDLVCNLRDAGLTERTYQITGVITMVDNFGNRSLAEGAEMILPWDAISQMNCDNKPFINLAAISERFDLHPALEGD